MSNDPFRIKKNKEQPKQNVVVDEEEQLRLKQMELERQKLELERKRIEKEKREKAKAEKEKSQQFNKEEFVSTIQNSVYENIKPLENTIYKVAETINNSLNVFESQITETNLKIKDNKEAISQLCGIITEMSMATKVNFNTEQHNEDIIETNNNNINEMPIEKLMFLHYMLTGRTIRKDKATIIEKIKNVLN
jgi:hypothetical protein